MKLAILSWSIFFALQKTYSSVVFDSKLFLSGWYQRLIFMALDQREVTDSGGRKERRVFIRTLLQLPDGQSWPIEINLTERRNMAFPMLLGRSAMRRRCWVNPSRSWLLGLAQRALTRVTNATPE